MISGDNKGSANFIAKQLNIDQVFSNILPNEKAQIINELKSHNTKVAMVGDGINDAPALAVADIGISMGSGTDAAIQASGIALMNNDPKLIFDSIDISRKTYNKIKQNLFWAFIYNIIGIPLAAAGLLNPMLAGLAMAFSSVSVIVKRSDSGYRLYNETDIHNLIFIKQARELGFSLEEIKKLLNLWRNKKRSSFDVKKLAMAHIEKLNQKIAELKMMKNSLENLVDHCQGNGHPDCAILDAISIKK